MVNAMQLLGSLKRKMTLKMYLTIAMIGGLFLVGVAGTFAGKSTPQLSDDQGSRSCANLPSFSALKSALATAVAAETSGLDNQMWATLVNRDGAVCAVAFSGVNRGAQWPGSRAISAQKANTANAFSLDASSHSGQFPNGLALSTANLYSAVQPGGSLYGLQHSNPVDTSVAYAGPSSSYGTASDPSLGLYAPGHVIVGGMGVSGDTSCRDHNVAWGVRNLLGLDHLAGSNSSPAVGGVSGDAARPDNIVFDITVNPNGGTGKSAGGFGHPLCGIRDSGAGNLTPVEP